jgi:hypothetical protein
MEHNIIWLSFFFTSSCPIVSYHIILYLLLKCTCTCTYEHFLHCTVHCTVVLYCSKEEQEKGLPFHSHLHFYTWIVSLWQNVKFKVKSYYFLAFGHSKSTQHSCSLYFSMFTFTCILHPYSYSYSYLFVVHKEFGTETLSSTPVSSSSLLLSPPSSAPSGPSSSNDKL